MIRPHSMILTIGQTGSGKTNSIVEFLHRTSGKWYEIIIFTGSNSDEPIYNFLRNTIDGIIITNDPEELPKISDYEDSEDKGADKLVVFDDSVLGEPKVLKEISKWFMMARKLGFTCMFLSQDFHKVPPFIRRNVHYIQLFKMTDRRDLRQIFSKVAGDIPLEQMERMYDECTKSPGNFLTIDLRASTPAEKYRHNFIGKLL